MYRFSSIVLLIRSYSLGDKNDPVERIGDDENRQIVMR